MEEILRDIHIWYSRSRGYFVAKLTADGHEVWASGESSVDALVNLEATVEVLFDH